ncbi:MAG: hypothetical protein OXG13_07405 [Gemmatimonadaceae bacterium]|nr:hypothetical protein [Gemmatimonadaceae bacterium]
MRARFLEVLGMDHIPEAVDATAETVSEDGVHRELRLSYVNSLGETLTGAALVPLDPPGGQVPGVVCMHGTGGTTANVLARELEVDPESGQLRGWGRELASRGYATISISLKGSVVRRATEEAWEEEAKLLEAYGRPHAGIVAEEALLAARALGGLPEVDGARIGLTGMSLGGMATWTAMASDPSIRAGAAVCGVLGSLARLIHEGNIWRHSSLVFVPHLLRYFDHGDIVAGCIAPRPFMAVAPLDDVDMPSAAVDDLVRTVAPAYAETSERFVVHRPPGGHIFTVEAFEQVVAWFGRFL